MALIPLSKARDAEVAGGPFDVRGWEVRTELDDEGVGKVDDMLLDEGGRARYLDVDLGLFKKHVLLPIGQARADGARDIVWVPAMSKDHFKEIPEYDRDAAKINQDYEYRLSDAYAGAEEGRLRRHRGDGDHTEQPQLATMGDLKLKVADDQPNPEGWDVLTSDGRKIGEVEELIVDSAAMKVRYLDVDLDSKKLGFGDRDRHVLVPVGYAQLDRDEKKVFVEGISADEVVNLPVYGGLPLRGDFEEQTHRSFRQRIDRSEFYQRPQYDDNRLFADRRRGMDERIREARTAEAERSDFEEADLDRPRDAGVSRTELRSREQELDARERQLRAREATSARRDADDAAARADADDAEGEREIRIRVRGDEIIVEKRPHD